MSAKFFTSTVKFEVLQKYRYIVKFLSLFKIRPSGTSVIWVVGHLGLHRREHTFIKSNEREKEKGGLMVWTPLVTKL